MRKLLIAVAVSVAYVAIVALFVKLVQAEGPIYHEWYKADEYRDPGDSQVACLWYCEGEFHEGGKHETATGGWDKCPYPRE